MLEVVLSIILAPIAVIALICLGAMTIGFFKGFKKGFKRKK